MDSNTHINIIQVRPLFDNLRRRGAVYWYVDVDEGVSFQYWKDRGFRGVPYVF
jgi:hypothetical protein